MITIGVLILALFAVVDAALAHARVGEIERDLHTMAQRMERLDARRSDELRHLRIVTEQAFGPTGSPVNATNGDDYP